MLYAYPFVKYAHSNSDPSGNNVNQSATNTGPQGDNKNQPAIIDHKTLSEIGGYATLPAFLAVISALLTNKPAIPLALALAGLGAVHYIPWIKENINVVSWADALFGGNKSNNAPANQPATGSGTGTSASSG